MSIVTVSAHVQNPFSSCLDFDSPTGAHTSVGSTTALLIRRAHTDASGAWLPGRRSGVSLSAAGLAQAERLGRALGAYGRLGTIYTGPLDRARTTAMALSRYQASDIHECDDLSDIDFGAWTGRTFVELDADPAWHVFNSERATALVPCGEQPADVQKRIVSTIARLTASHPCATIAVISHADVLRFALLDYRSISLDLYHCFEIQPASVSAVSLSSTGARILYVNNTTFAAQS